VRRIALRVPAEAVLCCALPTALVAAGSARLAALAFFGGLGAFACRLALQRRADELLCLVLAVSPFLNFLRSFAFYNVVIVVFAGVLLLRFADSPAGLPSLVRRYPMLPWLTAFLALYWLVSFVLTGRYDVNLRAFEMVAATAALLIVARHRVLVAATLRGLVASSCAFGLALLPHLEFAAQDRLGIVVLEGHQLGNPIQLGIPLALGFLALVADRGRWMGLERRPLVRVLVLVPVCALLALTTSRVAWLVAAGGVLCVLLVGRGSRTAVISAVAAGALVLQLIHLSPAGGSFDAAVDRTFGEERSARNRTSGRSDQWKVAWYALNESTGRLLWGFGPGLGPKVYARKSVDVPGVEFNVGQEMSLHSYYMQVAVEAGLLGLLPLLVWFGVGAARVASFTRRTRLALPLACFAGFVLIAATVSGNDTISGILLGLGLVATAPGGGPRVSAGHRNILTRGRP
jgi:O-antigen ligase